MDIAARIAENLHEVRERIARAAAKSGRSPDAITLVGVTKYVDAAVSRSLLAAGCHDLGESRPQALWQKGSELAGEMDLRWHFIGHLQRNKARRTLPYLSLLHSLDNLALAETLHADAAALGRRLPVLLEVKIAADATKHGFPPEDLPAALEAVAKLSGLEVRGLMAMASLDGGLDAARRDFEQLRMLRDQSLADCPGGVSLGELSMGMSGDYEVAIEDGATMVRVGSALFQGVA
jgi:pyridoxal phosphate enzyme (YggS family)